MAEGPGRRAVTADTRLRLQSTISTDTIDFLFRIRMRLWPVCIENTVYLIRKHILERCPVTSSAPQAVPLCLYVAVASILPGLYRVLRYL